MAVTAPGHRVRRAGPAGKWPQNAVRTSFRRDPRRENPGYRSEIPPVDEPGVGMQNLCDSGSVGELADGGVDIDGQVQRTNS